MLLSIIIYTDTSLCPICIYTHTMQSLIYAACVRDMVPAFLHPVGYGISWPSLGFCCWLLLFWSNLTMFLNRITTNDYPYLILPLHLAISVFLRYIVLAPATAITSYIWTRISHVRTHLSDSVLCYYAVHDHDTGDI